MKRSAFRIQQSAKPAGTSRAFTLTEMMIAIALLLVVIIATSQIFGTASKVTGLGQATQSVMQDAAAIERQFRDDIAALTSDGFLAIRNVAVANNVKLNGPLLNPNLPNNARIRADQLVFFANGVSSLQTHRAGAPGGIYHKGQGTASRIYYGHAFQLPLGPGVIEISNSGPTQVRAQDPQVLANNTLRPWYPGPNSPLAYDMVGTMFRSDNAGNPPDYQTVAGVPATLNANQPQAREWILARHQITLADDDDNIATATSKVVFLGDNRAAKFLLDPVIRNGRVDAVAEQLNEIRRSIVGPAGLTLWPAQRDAIQARLFYPRAEKKAPSMNRVDQALTNHVLASSCSSFRVEWTYDDGIGFAENPNNAAAPFLGVIVNPGLPQPWFGLTDIARDVYPYDTFDNVDNFTSPAETTITTPVGDNVVESYDAPGTGPVEFYEATFGYNRRICLNGSGVPDAALGYTPFPTALRVTMTLHDPEGRLENGREFQFVVQLPKSVR